jgi:hypothetical protein
MMGVISSEAASEMVRAGTHFVICCQAIQSAMGLPLEIR